MSSMKSHSITLLLAAFVLCSAVGAAPAQAAAAGGHAGGADTGIEATFQFDIPAQPLQSAIEAYSAAAGVSVLYLGTLAIGRTSAPVRGRYTPQAALDRLLEGTDLAIGRTTPEAYVLMRTEQGNTHGQPVPPQASDQVYYGAVQAGLREVLCRDARIAPADYRAALQFWVEPGGRIAQVRLLDTTGDQVRDAAMVEALRGTVFARPPDGLQQPFTLLILPRGAAPSVTC